MFLKWFYTIIFWDEYLWKKKNFKFPNILRHKVSFHVFRKRKQHNYNNLNVHFVKPLIINYLQLYNNSGSLFFIYFPYVNHNITPLSTHWICTYTRTLEIIFLFFVYVSEELTGEKVKEKKRRNHTAFVYIINNHHVTPHSYHC